MFKPACNMDYDIDMTYLLIENIRMLGYECR